MGEACKIMGSIEEEMDDKKELQKWLKRDISDVENVFDGKHPIRGTFCNHEESKIGPFSVGVFCATRPLVSG